MLITLNGIVTGIRTIGENNCYIDIFTDTNGMIEVIAHGVKKINSKNMGGTSLFSYSKFCLSKSGTRYVINSCEPIYTFYNISKSIESLSLAAYFSEVIKYSVTSEENHSELLKFVAMTFYHLEKNDIPLKYIKAIFEFRFITHIGFMPDLRACRNCICYKDDIMYFMPEKGFIECHSCHENSLNDDSEYENFSFQLNETLLHTLRYIAYSENEKLFKFRISDDNLELLAEISEFYLITQLGKTFKTLDYYKNILLCS